MSTGGRRVQVWGRGVQGRGVSDVGVWGTDCSMQGCGMRRHRVKDVGVWVAGVQGTGSRGAGGVENWMQGCRGTECWMQG